MTRLRCLLGLHEWTFGYAPALVPGHYRAEVFCLRCLDVSAHPTGTPRALCVLGVHRFQWLKAPPTWVRGDAIESGHYCIWCGRKA